MSDLTPALRPLTPPLPWEVLGIYGRPRLAKRSVRDRAKVKIAPVHSDFVSIIVREGCLTMLSAGASTVELQHTIVAHIGIVDITLQEAHHLDHTLKLKTRMLPGWRFE